ncbi:hypothetical protein ACFL0O_03105 [Thermodesulfobacteriota bacterium]
MRENNRAITKILLLIAIGIATLASAVLEGYTDNIQGYVIAFFAILLIVCIRSVSAMSFRLLLSLILFGFSIGFITQSIGVTSDMWCYDHTFIFAAFSWSLATVTMVEISRKIRLKMGKIVDKPLNVITILLIFAAIPLTLHLQDQWTYAKYRPIPKEYRPIPKECGESANDETKNPTAEQTECFICKTKPDKDSEKCAYEFEKNVPFWLYYITLTVFAVITSYHLSFTELISLILAAWIMGGSAEWVGATAKLWHFRTKALPPLFLVLGCWPLEFLVIRNLAFKVLPKRDDPDILTAVS